MRKTGRRVEHGGASVRDVAEAAGVSITTVSNVLNGTGKVSAGTAERVTAIIERMGFVRNESARQLRAGRSRSIGLIILDMSNPFFAELTRGAQRRAKESDLRILVGNSDLDLDQENSYLELFEEQRVRGVLLSSLVDGTERLERLHQRGVPVVLVDQDSDSPSFSSVAVDDHAGGYLAASHLLSIGRRRITFVGAPSSVRQAADRLAGARAALRDYPDAKLDVIETDMRSVEGGRVAGETIRARGHLTDAVFTANDLLALGVLQAIGLNDSIRIPEDIALIGYNDIALAAAAVIPLSSVRQPTEQLGYRAVDLLLRDLSGATPVREHVVFQPELVVRQSTVGR